MPSKSVKYRVAQGRPPQLHVTTHEEAGACIETGELTPAGRSFETSSDQPGMTLAWVRYRRSVDGVPDAFGPAASAGEVLHPPILSDKRVKCCANVASLIALVFAVPHSSIDKFSVPLRLLAGLSAPALKSVRHLKGRPHRGAAVPLMRVSY